MKQALVAAILFAAAPFAAHAQSERAPNLTNPMMRSTEQMEPTEAHRVEHGPGFGQAKTVPTPVLPGQPTTTTDTTPGPAHGPIGR